ncbi:hypothetical protein H2202_003145 [Exophiala xenobiotica]|nr:hypothetical protein H2202_003145 [Exophiala xenobiotica]KAK5210971.1 hypothetical protein LTR41_003583 [Exophiala xenobiotica]
MSSAFFRRPGDGSSSSSSDTEDEASEDIEQGSQQIENDNEETGDLGTTESISSHGSISLGDSHDASLSPFAGVDHHRTNLLNALLEDFARNRACEILKEAQPGFDYNRSSPEVQPLARKLYDEVRQSLAHTGVLPPMLSKDSHGDKQTRATYLAGLESIALNGLQKAQIPPDQPQSFLTAPEGQLGLARISKQQSTMSGRLLEQPIANLSLYQTQNALSSPYADLVSSATSSRRSHYDSSFRQLSLLGKGGFGRVYHTFNIFDKKEYAVKKIPLSPRLSQRYKELGHQELEHVLREVQALAQLEHINVVRYHATWIEEPLLQSGNQLSTAIGNRRLITSGKTCPKHHPRKALPRPLPSDQSDGIVFGSDSVSHVRAHDLKEDSEPLWSMRHADPEPSSARPSEIFTDGHEQPNAQQETVMDESVYVLHVQMSVYPMTLAQYLAPPPENARSAPSSPLRRHCFHLVPALRILLGILCGLQYIHDKGLVHRDIKPSNIFVSNLEMTAVGLVPQGYYDVGNCFGCPHSDSYFVNPRIGDFGLVAELARNGDMDEQSIDSQPNKAVGTEYYRPPRWNDPKETWKSSSAINEKLDVFALGVVLVEMLWYCTTKAERSVVLGDLQKGRLPTGLTEKINKEGHEPGTGDLVRQCILGMIQREPRRRWSCTEVKEWVEKILANCKIRTADDSNGTGVHAGFGFDLQQVRSMDTDAKSQ